MLLYIIQLNLSESFIIKNISVELLVFHIFSLDWSIKVVSKELANSVYILFC